MSGFKNEAEGYAASLRQQAACIVECGFDCDLDECELCAAADFIDSQQAVIDQLRSALAHFGCGVAVHDA